MLGWWLTVRLMIKAAIPKTKHLCAPISSLAKGALLHLLAIMGGKGRTLPRLAQNEALELYLDVRIHKTHRQMEAAYHPNGLSTR